MALDSLSQPVTLTQPLPIRPTAVEVFHDHHIEHLRKCLERRQMPWLFPSQKQDARKEARHHIRLARQYRGAMV